MAHKIRFQCSDCEVTARDDEPVLDAAVRAGLNVDYGCNNGNCGRCSARLLDGSITKIRHYDYVQSAAEKEQKQFLMCSYTAASDLVLDAQVGAQGTAIPEQCLRAKVREVTAVADEVRVLALRTPRSQRLRFLAGQYARLSDERFGEVQCSIASCPCEDRRLEFHVPRTRSAFSDYVFEQCRAGDELDVAAPFGHFVFSEERRRPALLIAFETGFAPVKSVIEHVTGQDEEVPLHLYRIAAAGKPYFDNLCRAWSDAFDRFAYTPMTLAADDGEAGAACARRIVEEHPDLSGSDVYVCAPPAIGDAVAHACLEHGLASDRLFRETLRGSGV